MQPLLLMQCPKIFLPLPFPFTPIRAAAATARLLSSGGAMASTEKGKRAAAYKAVDDHVKVFISIGDYAPFIPDNE